MPTIPTPSRLFVFFFFLMLPSSAYSSGAATSPPARNRSGKPAAKSDKYCCSCCTKAEAVSTAAMPKNKLGELRLQDKTGGRGAPVRVSNLAFRRGSIWNRRRAPNGSAGRLMAAMAGRPGTQDGAVAGFGHTNVSARVSQFVTGRLWSDHHPFWHAVHRWNDLSTTEQRTLLNVGWNPPRDQSGAVVRQEGDPGNGVRFAGMHGGMFEGIGSAGMATDIPAWDAKTYARLRPLLHPVDQQSIDILMELNAVPLTTTGRPDTKVGRTFHSMDDFANWIQTQREAETHSDWPADIRNLAGVHNRVHVALSDPRSAIDMGDPGRNLGNRDFWGWHGVINEAINRYQQWYATDAERTAYKQIKTEEIARMDQRTTEGAKLSRLVAATKAAGAADPATQKILDRIIQKTRPIARPEDLPPSMRESFFPQ